MTDAPRKLLAFDGRPYLYLCDDGCRFVVLIRDADLARAREPLPMDRISCVICYCGATLSDVVVQRETSDDDPTP